MTETYYWGPQTAGEPEWKLGWLGGKGKARDSGKIQIKFEMTEEQIIRGNLVKAIQYVFAKNKWEKTTAIYRKNKIVSKDGQGEDVYNAFLDFRPQHHICVIFLSEFVLRNCLEGFQYGEEEALENMKKQVKAVIGALEQFGLEKPNLDIARVCSQFEHTRSVRRMQTHLQEENLFLQEVVATEFELRHCPYRINFLVVKDAEKSVIEVRAIWGAVNAECSRVRAESLTHAHQNAEI